MQLDSLLDVELLAQFSPVVLTEADADGRPASPSAVLDREWSTGWAAAAFPCATAPLLERRVGAWHFTPCARGIVDTHPLRAKLRALLIASTAAKVPRAGAPAIGPASIRAGPDWDAVNTLRSGLWYSGAIKRAASSIVAALNGTGGYIVVHVRLGDKRRENPLLDRDVTPEALLRAVRLWLPAGGTVYVTSAEPTTHLVALLAEQYTVRTTDDFGAQLTPLANNYRVYAAETLVAFGGAAYVETMAYQTKGVADACFAGAHAVRVAQKLQEQRPAPKPARGSTRGHPKAPSNTSATPPALVSSGVVVGCVDPHLEAAVINGVIYGSACTSNPPCGTSRMHLSPRPEACDRPPLDLERPRRAAASGRCLGDIGSDIGMAAGGGGPGNEQTRVRPPDAPTLSERAHAPTPPRLDSGNSSTCRPRLYVYDLPDEYRDPEDTTGRGFGRAVRLVSPLPGFPPGVRLWDSQQYQLGEIVYQRSLVYRCRTHDASTADLFLVPAFSARPSVNRSGERRSGKAAKRESLLTRLRAVSSLDACTGLPTDAIAARGGADHVLVSGGDGLKFQERPLAELDLYDDAFGEVTRFALQEDRREWARVHWMGALRADLRFRSLPYPSMVHLDGDSEGAPWWVPAATDGVPRRRDRPLIAATFAEHGSPEVIALRRAVLASCMQHPSLCTHIAPEARNAPVGAQRFSHIAKLYWGSTYCVMPPGDTITRKGIVDAMLLGCIPVLLHVGQAWQWPWHWGGWVTNATVLLMNFSRPGEPSLARDLVPLLRAIPAERVEAMQRTIARHAHRLQYSATDSARVAPHLVPPEEGDAFDIALRGAWAAASTPDAVAVGKSVQMPPMAHGYCEVTKYGEGTRCYPSRRRGSWRLLRLSDCMRKCRACAQCHYVSFNSHDFDCSWFRSCDALEKGPASNLSSAELQRASRDRHRSSTHWTWKVRHENGSFVIGC